MLTGKLAEAVFTLSVDSTKLMTGLADAEAKAQKRLQAISSAVGGLAISMAAVFSGGVLLLRNWTKAATEAEGQQKRFRAEFALMGPEFEALIPEAEAWADAMKEASDFDNEDLLTGLQQATQVTHSYTDATLLMENATNLANLRGLDLTTTQNALIQAYNGNGRAIKRLIGDLGEGVIGHEAMLVVQERVRGGNDATAQSTDRAYRRMMLAWEDAREKLGQDLLPTVIKLYDWLGSVAHALEGVNGKTVAWGIGLAGLSAAVLTVTKWVIDFRLALINLAAAQGAANAGGARMLGWLRGIPGAAAAAVVAIGTVVAALKDLQAVRDREAAALAGGEGGPEIWTEKGQQTAAQISAESSPKSSAYDVLLAIISGGASTVGENLMRRGNTQSLEEQNQLMDVYRRRSAYQRELKRNIANNEMNSEDWEQAERSHFSHSESIRSQTNYRTNFLP